MGTAVGFGVAGLGVDFGVGLGVDVKVGLGVGVIVGVEIGASVGETLSAAFAAGVGFGAGEGDAVAVAITLGRLVGAVFCKDVQLENKAAVMNKKRPPIKALFMVKPPCAVGG